MPHHSSLRLSPLLLSLLSLLHASAFSLSPLYPRSFPPLTPLPPAELVSRAWVEGFVIRQSLCPWASLSSTRVRCVGSAEEMLAATLEEAMSKVREMSRHVSLLAFHPSRLDHGPSCSADPSDAGHYSVRSPLPTFQILRDRDLRNARKKWRSSPAAAAYPSLPGALGLLQRNKARLREIGTQRLSHIFAGMRAEGGAGAGGVMAHRAAVLRGGGRRNPAPRMSSEQETQIPLTMLSGFLGAGKTTLLRHLLENKAGLKVGVVVNDVASVNVDAKLVQRDGREEENDGIGEEWAEDVVELSNGCACCSAGDDFFGALAQLVSLAFMRNIKYDHIVFEASGVAEPKLLRAMFQEAASAGWPLMNVVKLENMCTVVDASNFLELFDSKDRIQDRQDLGYTPPEEQEGWAGVLNAMGSEPEEAKLSVVQLLAEQIEIADVLVLNKADRVSTDRIRDLEQTLVAINGFADIIVAEFGKVPFEQLLVPQRNAGVAISNDVMDHQSAVDFAKWLRSQPEPATTATPEVHEHSHTSSDHSHEHNHASSDHGHEHSHEHNHASSEHSHEHNHASSDHNHEHSHEHSHANSCDDPDCTDPSHSHEHSHDRQQTTASTRFGIRTFVYARRRPFSPARLTSLLGNMRFVLDDAACKPLTTGRDAGGSKSVQQHTEQSEAKHFDKVLRSKGFLWLSGEDGVAFYWSQAGSYLELSEMGRWWASVPRNSWPEAHAESILADFEGEEGDRRQELVFIGTGLSEDAICKALDACLLTDDEMIEQRSKVEKASK